MQPPFSLDKGLDDIWWRGFWTGMAIMFVIYSLSMAVYFFLTS